MKPLKITMYKGDDIVAISDDSANLHAIKNDWRLLPPALFVDRVYTYEDFEKWLKTRVPPKNTIGLDKLLKELGLNYYNPIAIAKKI